MKNEILLHPFFKYFITVFIFLAFIVSLFPPYEWGNERLRTLEERRSNRDIKDKLPVKTYDLIFNDNKKYFKIGDYSFEKKYYPDNYHKIDKVIDDAIDYKYESRIDTFKSSYRIAYKQQVTMPTTKERKQRVSKVYSEIQERIDEMQLVYQRQRKRQARYEVEHSINFGAIKREYELNPDEWLTREETQVDSIEEFRVYMIKKPYYFLLSREVITSELVINYLLSIFLSIAIGLIVLQIQRKYLIK